MAEWPGAEVKQWPGQEYQAPAAGGQIDLDKLTDPTEQEFVKGRRGQMPEQDIEESIRQYRAIKKADEGRPTLGDTRPLPKTPVVTPKDELEQIRATQGEEAAQAYKTRMTQRGEVPTQEPPPERTELPQETRSPSIPAQPQGKPWYEPRIGWEDLKGPVGQSALAAGLAGSALGGGIPGFVAGSVGALLTEEGTRRLQEDIGEVPGFLVGTGISALTGMGIGKAMTPYSTPRATRIIPSQGGEPIVLSGPEDAIYGSKGLFESIPSGGAYSATELLTEPSTHISNYGQFSTGSGKSLFGEGLVRTDTPEQLGWDVTHPDKIRKSSRMLREKLPKIEEQQLSKSQIEAENKQAQRGRIDMGSTTPEGAYIPPREYRETPNPNAFRRWWNTEKRRWGQELPVLRNQPESNTISVMEASHVAVEDAMENLSRQPWLKSIMKLGDNRKIAPLESKWVADYQAGRDWQSGVPQDIRTMMEYRAKGLAEENSIRRRRGLPEIHETPGPYFPRMTDEEFRLMRVISREHEGAKTSSSVGPFTEERIHPTMEAGLKEGVTYADWRKAVLLREVRGQVLKATDQMMTELEKGKVISRTKEAAEQASSTGKAYPADGLPFKPKDGTWWVRSDEERQFLLQNLRKFDNMSDMRTWINQYIRNPSLVNPWPHIVKNMGLKQMQQAVAGGLNPAAVLKNTMAYRQMQAEATERVGGVLNPRTWLNQIPKHLYPGGADMIEEFKQVMPFTESGRTVWELMSKIGPRTMTEKVAGLPSTLNGFAREKIFAEWDPAMRYGLWREYVRKGMSPQEAANHTWIDLIRYGTRADRIDAWNARPFNFFVPWRVGTLRTMNKAIQSAPVRFGLFMGAVDTLREWDFRQNGRWTHLPYDYIERPLMTLLTEGPGEAAGVALTTLVFGPGGDYALRTVKNLIDTVEGTGGLGTVKTVAWGLAQMYDLWPQWEAYQKDGNTQHIVDMFGLALLGRHGAPYGGPPRIMKYAMPESVIPYAPEVKKAERRGDAIRKLGGMKEQRKLERDLRRYDRPMQPTIPPVED